MKGINGGWIDFPRSSCSVATNTEFTGYLKQRVELI